MKKLLKKIGLLSVVLFILLPSVNVFAAEPSYVDSSQKIIVIEPEVVTLPNNTKAEKATVVYSGGISNAGIRYSIFKITFEVTYPTGGGAPYFSKVIGYTVVNDTPRKAVIKKVSYSGSTNKRYVVTITADLFNGSTKIGTGVWQLICNAPTK